jgi:hypothetical protein
MRWAHTACQAGRQLRDAGRSAPRPVRDTPLCALDPPSSLPVDVFLPYLKGTLEVGPCKKDWVGIWCGTSEGDSGGGKYAHIIWECELYIKNHL